MPSYAIHLAIANEMIRKNRNNILDKEKFILGSIIPDLEKKKNKFHIGLFEKYVIQGLRDDFDKGYLLHLLADEKFYFFDFRNEYLNDEKDDIDKWRAFCSDYNKLVPILIKKYNITNYPQEIEKYMQGEEGEIQYIKPERVFEFIDKISDLILDDVIINLRKIFE